MDPASGKNYDSISAASSDQVAWWLGGYIDTGISIILRRSVVEATLLERQAKRDRLRQAYSGGPREAPF